MMNTHTIAGIHPLKSLNITRFFNHGANTSAAKPRKSAGMWSLIRGRASRANSRSRDPTGNLSEARNHIYYIHLYTLCWTLWPVSVRGSLGLKNEETYKKLWFLENQWNAKTSKNCWFLDFQWNAKTAKKQRFLQIYKMRKIDDLQSHHLKDITSHLSHFFRQPSSKVQSARCKALTQQHVN